MPATNNALRTPLHPSKALASIVGKEPLSRAEVVRKIWDYIKERNLQNPDNRREILADDKLKSIVGASRVSMFELSKHLSRNVGAGKADDAVLTAPSSHEDTPPAALEAKGVFARKLFDFGRIVQGFVAPVRPPRPGTS